MFSYNSTEYNALHVADKATVDATERLSICATNFGPYTTAICEPEYFTQCTTNKLADEPAVHTTYRMAFGAALEQSFPSA